MSSKMNQRSQIKKSKTKRSADKMDKAMNDVKKIGIVSCCLIAVLLVIGMFIDTDESYAAGFLAQVPYRFESSVNNYKGGTEDIAHMHTLIGKDTDTPIALPWEFYSEKYYWTESDTEPVIGRLGFIYCLDRNKIMTGGVNYTKNASIKSSIDIYDNGKSQSYPGLIYILRNDVSVEEGSPYIPKDDSANYVNYYIAQVAIWYYLDEVNQADINFTAEQKQVIETEATSGNFYAQKVIELKNGALNYKDITDDGSTKDVIIDESSISFTMFNDYVETSVIRPTSSNASFESYSIQVNGNENNIQIIDEAGNPITGEISANQGFKVRVPVSALQNNTFTIPVTVVGYFANGYDAYMYTPDDSNAQKALLGIVEKPSTPTSFTLQVPTINVPDTASTSYLVYGIGSLVIIAGIVLIVVAKRPNNAKKK